jgi:Flp pilus assembly pilin Flp
VTSKRNSRSQLHEGIGGGRAIPVLLSPSLSLAARLLRDDDGQDLIEYALLATIIGIVGVLVWPSIVTKMGNGFRSWGTSVQSIWIPLDPH